MLFKAKPLSLVALVALIPGWAGVGAQTDVIRNQKRSRLVTPQTSRPVVKKEAASPEEPEADVLRIDTDLVNTLFTAVDRDQHFVTILKASDLRIYENDVPQEISLFERETNRPLTIALLVDTSKSQERTLAAEKRAAKTFIRSVIRPEKDHVAVVSFTGRPTFTQALTGNVSRLNRAVDQLRVEFPVNNPECLEEKSVQEDPLCWTSIWDSVWASTNEVLIRSSEDSRRAIILLSDGDDTSSTIRKQDAIESALKNNVAVYSIGIGDPATYKMEKDSLRNLSDKTGGRAFFPRDENELRAAFNQIQDELRSQYVLAYSPKNKTRDGARRRIRMEVVNPELRRQKLQLLYRQDYYAAKR